MRLVGTIIVALLAITMAILPISVPGAAASTEHGHAAISAGHVHDGDRHAGHGEPAQASMHCHDLAAAADCGEHAGGPHDQGDPTCCGGMSCHSFQVSTAPIVSSPVASAAPAALVGDEQVASVVSSRLDRPPRTA